jgi:ribosomal protein S18 acetylase RimI-like enzyme
MLVKLYTLPDVAPLIESHKVAGVDIRRAIPPEKHVVVNWVRQTFGAGWASECEVAFSNHPVSCFIAVEQERIIGFACYDATCKDFFGPEGVSEAARGRGIGKVLLLSCLHAMAAQGYAYAIIGGAGPVEFYARTTGATVIEGSVPGIYRGMLRE